MDLQSILSTLEAIDLKLCAMADKGLPIAALFAPQYAPEIKMAEFINSIVESALTAHAAAGGTPEATQVAIGTITQGLAASGLVAPDKAVQVQNIAAAAAPMVAAISPFIPQIGLHG